MRKVFEGFRVQIKGDTEENLAKATGFVPLDRELVVRKPDEKYKYPRLRVGDGKTNVNELPELNVQPDWEQNDPTQPDYIKNKPDITSGGAGGTIVTVGGIAVENFDADTKVDNSTFIEYKKTVAGYYNNATEQINQKTTVTIGDSAVETFNADSKLDKKQGAGAYYQNSDGSVAIKKVSASTGTWSIMERDGNGCTKVGTPTDKEHAANKEYVDKKLDKNSLYWDENVLYNEIAVADEYSGDAISYNAVISPFYLGIENNEGGMTHGVAIGTESVMVSRASGEQTIINWPMHSDGEQYGVVTLATTDEVDEKATRLDLIKNSNTGDGFIACMNMSGDGIERRYNVHGAYIGAYTIPLRVAGGRLHVGDPVESSQAATKKYVDEAIANAIASLPIYNGEVEEV